MNHKIKLRKATKNESVTCPYNVSGLCHRNGCIYLPHMECMKIGEYRHRMEIAKKIIMKKRKARERGQK